MSDDLYVLTNSEMGAYQHCKRCWYLGYYRNLQKRSEYRAALNIGTLVHRGLEKYYAKSEDPLNFVRTKAADFKHKQPEYEQEIQKDEKLALIMLEGYLEWLAETGADIDLDVYAVEEKLDVSINGEFILRGKLDARAQRMSDGAKFFLEHKTVQNFADLPKTAQVNQQFLSYALLEYLHLKGESELDDSDPDSPLRDRVDGVLLNMLRKVQRSAKAKPPFYAREEIRFNTNELRAHWKHIVGIGREIAATRARLDSGEEAAYVVMPTVTGECFWKCNFSALCMSGIMDDGSDFEGYIEEFYEIHDPLQRYIDEEE